VNRGLCVKLSFAHKLVSEAGRFGDAILCCAGEGRFDCIGERTFVADGDEDRFYIGAGSENCTDDLLVVFQAGIACLVKRRFVIFADKPAFCAADSRFVEEQAEMCGQAETSGVGDALAVDDKRIRCNA